MTATPPAPHRRSRTTSSHRRPVLAGLLALLVAGWAVPPHAAHGATAAQVTDALQRAKGYLYSVQKDGLWDEGPPPKPEDIGNGQSITGGQYTGPTALAVYALLAAGERHTEPKLAKAIDFLKKTPTTGTYALGLRMQIWLMLPQNPDVLAAMKRDANVLLKSMKAEGSAFGMYDYVFSKDKGYSHSRAQYGVLGIWAAEQMGFEVPLAYWQAVEKAWIGHQDASGGWTYMAPKETDHPVTPGMTAAGIATLFITQDYVHANAGVACKGNISHPSIEKGLQWMADHMDLVATDKQYPRDFHYPTLYAVERIGVAGGIKYFKDVDWFQKGSNWLLAKQKPNGSWTGGGTPLVGSLGDTCFAMLFLARGRAPVAFNKLDYGRGAAPGPQSPPWNQRPRDVANVTRWIGRYLEQDLAWQVTPITRTSRDLLDAPVLYISGNRPLEFTDEDKQKLREFVEMGGLILGNADCGDAKFAQAFRKLGADLFPKYEFRDLPENHALYGGPFPRKKWRTKPVLQGLGNEARELMVLVPQADPARFWQLRSAVGKEEFFSIAGAVLMYTRSDQGFRYRGDTHWVDADPKVKPTRSLKVARLQYPENWDPEPGGWRRVAAVARNDYRLDVQVEPVKLGDGKLASLAPPAVAHLTGTTSVKLTDAAKAEVKAFVEKGGTLVVDAAGGAAPFATAAEAELKALFPAGLLETLPPEHALYSPGGKPIEPVRYRTATRLALAGGMKAARLQAMTLNGRPAVIYSREDLSVGMVGTPVEGIIGYDPDTATNLMAAVLVHAAPKEPPTTRPTTGATTKPTTRTTGKGPTTRKTKATTGGTKSKTPAAAPAAE